MTFRVHSPSEDDMLELIAEPWRRGKRKYSVWLEGDRPSTMAMVSSYSGLTGRLSGSEDPTLIRGAIAGLKETIKTLREYVRLLEAELEAHPEQWEPLPTLAEFMEGGAK